MSFQGRKTFGDIIIEGKLSGSMDFTNEEINNEIQTLGITATETSATSLSFALKMLSIHPDIQQRVQSELSEVFEGSNRPVTREDLIR